MKILFLAINYDGWVYDTLYQEQLAIARAIPDATFYGPGYRYNTNYVPDIIKEIYGDESPDLIFSYIDAGRLLEEPISKDVLDRFNIPETLQFFPKGLEEICIPKAVWINDFWQLGKDSWDSIILGKGFDYVFSTYTLPFVKEAVFYKHFSRKVRETTIFIPWPRSINQELFIPHRTTKKQYDVALLGAIRKDFYPFRFFINKKLTKQKLFSYFNQQHPGYKYFNNESTALTGDTYRKAINSAKIFISCTSINKIPFIKIYEIIASNTLLMCDEPKGSKEIPLVDGYNYVKINRFNYKRKIKYYLENDKELDRIITNANKTFEEFHTTTKRAFDIKTILQELIQKDHFPLFCPQLRSSYLIKKTYYKSAFRESILLSLYYIKKLAFKLIK